MARTYSQSRAIEVVREALARTDSRPAITVKLAQELTAKQTVEYCKSTLASLGVKHASHFMMWTVSDHLQYERRMTCGVYEGMLECKNLGLIDHITMSTHAPPTDIMRFIKSGEFDGIMISYNVLNAKDMRPVLDSALEHNIGIAVMNPMAGGLLPNNEEAFDFIRETQDVSVGEAALRFVLSHPAVNIAVCGMGTEKELRQNIRTVKESDRADYDKRFKTVSRGMSDLSGFCTGCRYCDDCPARIPVPEIMQSRNTLLFDSVNVHTGIHDVNEKNTNLFYKLEIEYKYQLETDNNPCVACGQCESKCTQRLNIIEDIEDTYDRARQSRANLSAKRARLEKLMFGKGYRRVAFWPAGFSSTAVTNLYRQFFGEPDFELIGIDSNVQLRGTEPFGLRIWNPNDIPILCPDLVIVCNYRYDKEIMSVAKQYESDCTKIISLFERNDIPWAL